MAYLIFEDEGKKKKLTIKRDFIFIGQGEGNNLRLSGPEVSKQHCQLLRVDEGFRVLDLGSESGTFVNGEKVQQKDLQEGDVIRIGHIELKVMDVGLPAEAAPIQKPSTPARKPGRTAGRGARRSAGRAASREPEPLKIKAEYAAASEKGGDRIVRRQLRKGSKIPGWVQAVIAFWALVVVVLVVFWVIKQTKPSPYEGQYSKAQDYIRANQPDLAMLALEQIPREDYHWGEMAYELLDELIKEKAHGEGAQDTKRAFEYCENNVKLYINKYIDAPENKPGWARAIRRDYAPDRKCYIRAAILHRIDTYIERFPEGRQISEVKNLRRKYLKEVDLDAAPTYRDVEIEAECELNLNGFGSAYQLMAGWLKKYPETKFKFRIDDMMDAIWGQMNNEWEKWKTVTIEREKKQNYLNANKIYHRFIDLCQGYDDPKAVKLIAYWKSKMEANDKALEDMVGVKRRTEVK